MRSIPYIIIGQFIATSLAGLLGIEAGSSVESLYRTSCAAIALMLIIIVLIHDLITRARDGQIKLTTKNLNFTILYILLSITSFTGTSLLSLSEGGGLQLLLPTVLSIAILFLLGQYSFPAEGAKRVFLVILAFCFIASLYNLLANHDSVLSFLSIRDTYDVDLGGFFGNRNIMGRVMAIGALCGIYLFSERAYDRKIIFAMTLIVIISLILSMSRGGILFFLIASLLFIVLNAKNTMRALLIVALLAILSAPILTIPFVQKNFIRTDRGDTHRSSLRSSGGWQGDVNVLFGEGKKVISTLKENTGLSGYHNAYLETFLIKGGFGGLILALTLWRSLAMAVEIRSVHRGMGSLFIGLTAAFMVYSFFESVMLFTVSLSSVLITFMILLLPMFITNHMARSTGKETSNASI